MISPARQDYTCFYSRPISAVDWRGPAGASGEVCAGKILRRFSDFL